MPTRGTWGSQSEPAELMWKRRHECATTDHPVADKQSRGGIDNSRYPFRNQTVESLDRRLYAVAWVLFALGLTLAFLLPRLM